MIEFIIYTIAGSFAIMCVCGAILFIKAVLEELRR
jgi:hypothetical protein